MRFFLGTSVALFAAACSGAASTELFGNEPGPVAEASPTDPAGEAPAGEQESPARPIGGERDAAPPVDASAPDTKDAGKDAAKDADAAPPPPVKCNFDSECTGGAVCNWETDTCLAPGPLGDPCRRDLECTGGLCNWKLRECSVPAPPGTACRRNKECASGDCDDSTCE